MNLFIREENDSQVMYIKKDMNWEEDKFVIEISNLDVYTSLGKKREDGKISNPELIKLFNGLLKEHYSSFKIGCRYILSYNENGRSVPPYSLWTLSLKQYN